MTMNWQEVIKQEIDAAWKDGWLKGMEQGKAEALSAEQQKCSKNILDISDGITKIFEPQEQISKEDFKEYAKKEFNQNVEFVESDNPDTVESLFEPREVPLSETIRPVGFDDIGLEEAILDLDYIKELEDEIEDLRQRLTDAANCLSNILQIVKDPTPIEGSDYRRCCLIQSNIRKYATSLKESKPENSDLLELRIIFGRPLNG